jgi:hypothetical protein
MKKNDVLAALYTMGIIGVVSFVIYSIKEYPQYMGYIFTLLAALGIFLLFIHPLWDTIRYELDERDKRKREEILKKMMENDQKLGLYDFDLDLDENDKNQIG